MTAERFAAAGDRDSAILHRLRAIARQLEEDAVPNPVPAEQQQNSRMTQVRSRRDSRPNCPVQQPCSTT